MRSYRSISREMIAHQTDGFADKLVQAFEEMLKEGSREKAQSSAACKRIQEMTRKRFNMNLTFLVDTDHPPCCFPILVNDSHVLSTLQVRLVEQEQMGDFRKALATPTKLNGSINLKAATLGGDYSKLEMVVHINHYFSIAHFDARQAAAVFLHEVGHCFFGLEFMFRTARASQLLAALHQVKTGRDTNMTYVHAVDLCADRMAKEGLIKSPKELENLVAVKDNTASVTLTYSSVCTKLATDFGSTAQTGPNFEALADAFAVRFGLGDALATALNKIGEQGVAAGMAATMSYIVNTLAVPLFGATVGMFFVPGMVGMVAGIAVMSLLCFFFGGHSDIGAQQTNVYNTPIQRATRIRSGVIDALKNPKLSKEARESFLSQVKTLDSIINGKTDTSNLFDTMANLVFKYRRDAKNAFELEAQIEALSSNNLFVGANTLKKIA